MLKLKRRDLDTICRQAEEEYPSECCGLLTEAPGGTSRIHPCRNIQDRLHAEDPEQHPKDSRIAYFIDPQEQYNLLSSLEESGSRVSGIYHSHIDCDAYFSEEDKRRAMLGREPAYPDAVYLVLSVFGSEVRGHRAFAWDEESRDFVEADVEVVE